jgi:potassium-transporting ATPase KdpC subunit
MRTPSWVSNHLAALRAILVMTVLTGIIYPLVITGIAQIPGLQHKADGSLVKVGGTTVGSTLIGQAFVDAKGNPLVQYFQSRPSDAGDGYDPTATSASNLGPENVVDTLPNPADKTDEGKQSLLTQVCGRSLAVGQFEGVSGARPYCTPGGVGAVLVVVRQGGTPKGKITAVYSINEECPATPFISTYQGVAVQCGKYGIDYTTLGFITPIRGDAPSKPAVPSDAVTASGSGLDPDISPAYADLQAPRIARVRGTTLAIVDGLIKKYTDGRGLGFMGEPAVNVLQLNVALDQQYPYHS